MPSSRPPAPPAAAASAAAPWINLKAEEQARRAARARLVSTGKRRFRIDPATCERD